MKKPSGFRMRKQNLTFWTPLKTAIAIGIGAAVVILVVVLLLVANRTIKAEKGKMDFGLSADGIIIRSETLYRADNYGKIELIAEEGQAVTEGTPIATVYSWNYNDDDYQSLKVLQNTIMDYQQDNILKDVVNNQLIQLNLTIEEQAKEIRAVVKGDKEGNLLSLERNLKELMDERTDYLHESVSSDEQLSSFYEQEEELEEKIGEWKETTLAKQNGVVSFYFDGTETLLTPSNLDKLTVKNINNVLNGKSVTSSEETKSIPFYRIVDDTRWYVLIMTDSKVEEFSNGMSFRVEFDEKSDTVYNATIKSGREDSGKYIYTLEFKQPIGKLLQTRQVNVKISASYVGIQVPVNAVKTVDGLTGVYYQEKGNKVFEPVKVLIKQDGKAVIQPVNIKSKLSTESVIYP